MKIDTFFAIFDADGTSQVAGLYDLNLGLFWITNATCKICGAISEFNSNGRNKVISRTKGCINVENELCNTEPSAFQRIARRLKKLM